jgi:hypothetical protein
VKHCRGPAERDPGPKEYMYTEQWEFNKHCFRKNCYRLQVNSIARGQ